MQIAHIALWTQQLEMLRDFYVCYFGGVCNSLYINPSKGFESYFIRFDDGCQLELMRRKDISQQAEGPHLGLCHFAFSCASREDVLDLTERLRNDGIRIVGEPRTSGDGYFESVAADPDGNLVEIIFKA